MEHFTADYCNGIRQPIDKAGIEEALQEIEKNMAYTQADIKVYDDNGDIVALSKWYGVEPSEDDIPLATFGTFGFYDSWIDPTTWDYLNI